MLRGLQDSIMDYFEHIDRDTRRGIKGILIVMLLVLVIFGVSAYAAVFKCVVPRTCDSIIRTDIVQGQGVSTYARVECGSSFVEGITATYIVPFGLRESRKMWGESNVFIWERSRSATQVRCLKVEE